MKALFDTSVLIAAFTTEHPKHTACLRYLQNVRSGQINGYISAHCIAELYSVLTARTSPRILPADAQNIMNTNLSRQGYFILKLEIVWYNATRKIRIDLLP